jgi:peptidoglycan biosynthesis protein MviN/MurJ (putative lipid II flippase)
MQGLHTVVAVAVMAVNTVAFGTGLYYLRRRREPRRVFAHLVALGQTLLVAQAAIGLLLLSGDYRTQDQLHYVYGGLALAAVLSPWFYAPGDPRGRLAWFSGASLLAAALSVRAYTTGS